MTGQEPFAAEVVLGDPKAEISPLIYGQYLEHLEDCIYPAIWDEQSPQADEHGLRRDVIAAAVELGVPVVRWPGGCFADVYHWQDGIGARAERPVRRNWHWGGLEPNQFGTDEFLTWCEEIGASSYLNVNLGTGTLDEALRWMDYCTGTEDTADVLRRKANGRFAPYRTGLWGIGNETWGAWEAGTMGAQAYGLKLANWSDFALRHHPSVELLGIGSSEGGEPGWDRTVLDAAGAKLCYLTNHVYGYSTDRVSGAEYLNVAFTPVYFEARLRAMAAVLDDFHRTSGAEPVRIAVDEWNIRHFETDGAGGYRLNRASPRNVQDAVFVAGALNSMIRLSPVVGMANYVFLVNGNGVLNVRGSELVRTTLYHVFRQYRSWLRGRVIELDVRSPSTELPEPRPGEPGHVPVSAGLPARASYLDAVAAVDEGRCAVSLVNRHRYTPIRVRLHGAVRWRESWTLTDDDLYAVNDFDHPERVLPNREPIDPATTEWVCPPHSVTLLRGEISRGAA
ncbi:alpha-L-arabinofuranosidase C-terminal domain-containing protein [Sciscionella marina]|uniref:alpha-L-arabinofuranosidase C-terminal domain-containing protein n=1 Tax=Sciscionella marina TaxID=508770 RepID=UPI0003A14108|nr:alpha-L-arabinofuranosidase C-terminal domain-containing protein [Sciscionella marina]